ncbi:MAG: vWA domain-containing protein [Myxococcales bacterium]|jgi:hypothetical protein
MARSISRFLVPSLGLVALGGIALAACQNYEFEQVTPKAFGAVTEDIVITGKMLPPYIMLVVDKSGSMLDPAFSGSTTSKWDDLLSAFSDPANGFLPKSGGLARFGLALYPSAAGCDPGAVSVSLNADHSNVDTIITQLEAVAPEGGTPTALTLQNAAEDAALVNEEPGRLRFVMLLTDGLPNCNPSPENQARCDACNANHAVCRDLSQNGCMPTYGTDPEEPCDLWAAPKGSDCLDEQGTADVIATLRKSGIETFVIGFGDDFGGDGHRVLNRAAEAGGRAREGEAKYFKAANKEELIKALEKIIEETQQCTFVIDPAPTSEDIFQVVLYDSQSGTEEVLTKGSEWRLPSADLKTVEILDDRCTMIKNAQPDRYKLRFKYASNL